MRLPMLIANKLIDCTVDEIRTERARPTRPKVCPNSVIKSNNTEMYIAAVSNTGLDFSVPNNFEIKMELIVIGIMLNIIICDAGIDCVK